jgi:HAD superfamily hydrolase (TIGR01459 family)
MPSARFVPGIGAFADRYQAFILDQWGVVHDGLQPYPDVPDTLRELHRRGKRIVLLSNSGRRAEFSARRLAEIGLDLTLFTAVVTSGEVAWQGFRDRSRRPFTDLGRRCILLTREGDLTVAEGVGLELVSRVEDAEFLFLSGVEPPPVTADDYEPILAGALRRGLPILCANPDVVAVSGPELTMAPGTVAARYAARGGTVHYVGKPHAPVYRACFDALPGIAPSEIVAVGDSLAHDIKGANDAGMHSAFVTQGIHVADFPAGAMEAEQVTALARLSDEHMGRPDWVIPQLSW